MSSDTAGKVLARFAKYIGYAALIYVIALGLYSLVNYSRTKGRLLEYGANESTAELIAIAVMLLAIALPLAASVRIISMRGRVFDYAAVMVLPLISWGIKQMPAKFSSTTGEALQYCAERPDGTRFCRDRPGYDPMTGAELEKLTPDDTGFREDLGLFPSRIDKPFDEIEFFHTLRGTPLVYIWPTEDGCFEAFDNKGRHPVEGTELIPVTRGHIQAMRQCLNNKNREIAQQEALQIAEKQRAAEQEIARQAAQASAQRLAEQRAYQERYTNRTSSAATYGVAITNGQTFDVEIANALAMNLDRGQTRNFLRDLALQDGVFQRLYAGDSDEFGKLSLDAVAEQLIIGNIDIDYSENQAIKGVTNASATMAIRVVDPSTGSIVQSASSSVTSLGYSQSEARRKALDKLAEDLAGRLE